jgi:hypothetical protein
MGEGETFTQTPFRAECPTFGDWELETKTLEPATITGLLREDGSRLNLSFPPFLPPSLPPSSRQVLKRKKMYEQQRDQLAAQSFNVDQTNFALDSVKVGSWGRREGTRERGSEEGREGTREGTRGYCGTVRGRR